MSQQVLRCSEQCCAHLLLQKRKLSVRQSLAKVPPETPISPAEQWGACFHCVNPHVADGLLAPDERGGFPSSWVFSPMDTMSLGPQPQGEPCHCHVTQKQTPKVSRQLYWTLLVGRPPVRWRARIGGPH